MVEVPHHPCGSFGILTVEQFLFWIHFGTMKVKPVSFIGQLVLGKHNVSNDNGYNELLVDSTIYLSVIFN